MSFWSSSVATDLHNLRQNIPFTGNKLKTVTNDNLQIIINRLSEYAKLKKDHTEAALATLLFLKRKDKTLAEKTDYFHCLLDYLADKHSRRLLPYLNDVLEITQGDVATKVKEQFQLDLQKWSTGIWHRKDLRAGYNKVIELAYTPLAEAESLSDKLFSLIQQIGDYYVNHASSTDHRQSLTYLQDLKKTYGVTETISAIKYSLQQRSSTRLLKWIEFGESLIYPTNQGNSLFPAEANDAYERLASDLDSESRIKTPGIHTSR